MNEKYPLALPEGTVLAGQYIIEKVLGQGGFGITYEAKDYKTGGRVAVKEFFPDAMATRTNQTTVSAFSGERGESFAYGKTCFLQEAETLAKFIGNENIVRIHSYFEENETAYFVMDFIEGTSFDEYLKQRGGKIPYEEAAQILIPVMDALSAVHSQGIVHRDVTPDNIYITKEGIVKLLDFGAARYSLGDKSRSLDIILKHGFAPKEQYTRRGKQGPYTDVYALGATFYFALTGKRPPDSVERMDEDDLVPPSSLGVQLSDAAEDAILQALSVQPGDRFQSMMAFKNALLNLHAAVQPPLAAVGSRPTVSQTYFTAPDRTGIPHSGSMGSPAPRAGQDTDLQDLASTMKTAGKLAGRMAGRMAGKVAEKTAETAGVMAGTAGKMSEIMAAKKAEAAEKLAAKMAEREAEKAAREAEKAAREAEKAAQLAAAEAARQAAAEEAARQAAEQAAAEAAARQAAENTAGEAPESTVGRTVGITPGYTGGMSPDIPPSSTPPAKRPMNKKLLLIPAVAAIAVVLIAVLVLKPGGTGPSAAANPKESTPVQTSSPAPKATPSPAPIMSFEPTAAPTSTPEPARTPTGDLTLVGSFTGNIMNSGLIAVSDGSLYWIDDNCHSLFSGAEMEYIFESQNGSFRDLSSDGRKLFYRYNSDVYTYNLDTEEEEYAPYLDNFNGSIVRLFLTADYYVIGSQNSDGTVTVYLVSRTTGQAFECCTATGINRFTISHDGWLYYVGHESGLADGIEGIYSVNMATLERTKCLVNTGDPDYGFYCPIVSGGSLYTLFYSKSDNSGYSLIRMDRTNGYDHSSPIWDLGSELNLQFKAYNYMIYNVNYKTQDIFFCICAPEGFYQLYKMKGYDDGTFDIEQISEKSYLPNIVYYTSGNYRLWYLHYIEDADTYKLCYRDYDKDGNYINNN